MNFQPQGVIHECVTFFFSMADFAVALVKDRQFSAVSSRLNLCSPAMANEFTTVSELSEPEGRPGGRDRRVHLLSVFSLRGGVEHSRTSRHAADDDSSRERA